MKIILDTNVLISAIFFGGTPGTIIAACYDGKIQLVISPSMLLEYRDVAQRLAKRMPMDYMTVLEWIVTHSEMMADVQLNEQVCADADDDKFIAAALQTKARIICSGDKHLLDINGYSDIEVLKPKAFTDKYLKAK